MKIFHIIICILKSIVEKDCEIFKNKSQNTTQHILVKFNSKHHMIYIVIHDIDQSMIQIYHETKHKMFYVNKLINFM